MRQYDLKDIAEATITYLKGINNIDSDGPTDLIEEAQHNVKTFQRDVMTPYNSGKLNENIRVAIGTGRTIFMNEHPEEDPKKTLSTDLSDTAEIEMVTTPREKQSAQVRALVPRKEHPLSLKKAGYVNIAILLYGMLNIGIIVAIAVMKG